MKTQNATVPYLQVMITTVAPLETLFAHPIFLFFSSRCLLSKEKKKKKKKRKEKKRCAVSSFVQKRKLFCLRSRKFFVVKLGLANKKNKPKILS